jgi:tRNA threonylcarbamoyladenosine biosynthesis protein TsaE
MTRRTAERLVTLTGSELETEELGRRLAGTLSPTDVVFLFGGLGAGKTCLARGVARGLGASAREVASPTFSLLHEYAGKDGGIVLRHLDLYRLEDSSRDLQVLGLPAAVEGAPVLVEWPGSAIRRVLPPTVEVRLEVLPDERRRIAIDRLSDGSAAGEDPA